MTSVLALLFVAMSAADYAGSDVCAKCHRAEAESQAKSAHARAIARSKPPQPGDWAFGAGHQAITFVTRLDAEHYLEEGRTWYRRSNAYGRTPGAASDAGRKYRIFDPDAGILRCFSCHSTVWTEKLDSCLATPIEHRWRNTSIPSQVGLVQLRSMFISDRPRASAWPRLSYVRVYLSALAAELVLQSQSADMSRGLHGLGSVSVIVVQHAA